MDAHQHNPNPFENSKFSRREAILGVAGLAALVVGAGLADHARSYITRMTPSQREYLQGVLAANVSWTDISDNKTGEARWMAKDKDGASVTVTVRQTHKGEVRTVEVSDSANPFTYKCPEYRHSVHDQPVVERILASARMTGK